MSDENKDTREAFLRSLGIDYSATFVPQSASRNAEDKSPSLNWRVRLSRNGQTIVTDYMQGIGHVPGWRELPKTLYFESLHKQFNNASESGKYPHNCLREHKHEHGTRLDIIPGNLTKPLPPPELQDVLYCLVSDAAAYRMTFDEWCDEFGYDTDSRKAHAAYMTCSDLGLRLVRVLGGNETLERLQELFSEY